MHLNRPYLRWYLAAQLVPLVGAILWAGRTSADDERPSLAVAPAIAAQAHRADARVSRIGVTPETTKERIQDLIRQLGDPRYTTRRSAAGELRQIGAEAFDLLHAATGDSDPEVAASAHYLLRQISVRWVQNGDSVAVRALLKNFGSRSDEIRLDLLENLSELPNGEGIAGLCRIARFDRSPLVSRTAALAIIRPAEPKVVHSPIDSEVIERELGPSTREAATWIRRYGLQQSDPAASVGFWQALVDEEAERLEQNADDTSAAIVLGLLWNLAEIHRQLGNEQAIIAQIDRMLDLKTESAQPTVIELIEWLTTHKSWKVLDELLAKHQSSFEQNKRPLYYAALARAKQGKSELAEELAIKASQIEPQATSLESFFSAKKLEESGQFQWAVREYHRAIDDQPVASHEAILSRIYLASLLQDYEQSREAADALEPLVKTVQNEGQVGKLYAELLRYYRGRLALPEPDTIAARLHYYRACQYRAEKDQQRERGELELAIQFDPTDADVLIAMYRLPDPDTAWQESVRQRVRALCQQFQQEIDENPNDPSAYNQWAWLVGNTEGDFQKAIRYSHRSIELIPPGAGDSASASFLDTLGRCYYAAGDYANAVKYQRQALEKVDYMQVMHRQLALFEKTIAEKQGAASAKAEAEKDN